METVFTYEQMGTVWKVTIYEALSEIRKKEVGDELSKILREFDALYSRFKKDSLVYSLSLKTGIFEVPYDLVAVLRIYKQFYLLSHKKFTPCIGSLLEDVGYDSEYSLVEKSTKRNVPDFEHAVRIIDDTHIEFLENVLLDIGAIGKGYCVDKIGDYVRSLRYTDFLVDGSGDIYYESQEGTIKAGLEHPHDTTKVIGVVDMKQGAMCSSALNRREWGKYSHYIDPDKQVSPTTISATWVMAEKAAYADALSSLLFFVDPSELDDYAFEYCIMNNEEKIKKSPGFLATFFLS